MSHFHFSEIYHDDNFIYMHIIFRKDIRFPKKRRQLMDDLQFVGIELSEGWERYMEHAPEPNILLLRKPFKVQPNVRVTRASSRKLEQSREEQLKEEKKWLARMQRNIAKRYLQSDTLERRNTRLP